jgi:hypothetical protein
MNKLLAFVRLDFMSIKPYFPLTSLLIFAALALFLTRMSGGVSLSIGVGMMLGTIFVSYPFIVGEKNNMDALYVTLSVSRKTVVLGRYVFTLAIDLCTILAVLILSSCGLLAVRGLNIADGTVMGGVLTAADIAALVALMAFTQAVQLPIYFKFGYTRAKFLRILPFAAIVAGYAALSEAKKGWPGSVENIINVLSNHVISMAVLALVLVIAASIALSLAFYQRREF